MSTEIKYILFRKEKIQLQTALDLLLYCNNKEALEIYKAIEAISPSTAIIARSLRNTHLKVKKYWETRNNFFASNHKQETKEPKK